MPPAPAVPTPGESIPDSLIAQLKIDEGCVTDASGRHIIYVCPAGFKTIGYGHRILPGEDFTPGLSEAEACDLLRADIARVAIDGFDAVFDKADIQGLTPARYAALLNMIFNLGATRFGKFKKTIAAIKSGNWALAAQEAQDSRWFKQVGARAQRICTALRAG